MSATGLQVFDRTLQITNIWLNEISEPIGSDRKMAWAVLGAVLRVLRDRLPVNVSAHLAAELPLLVRGAFYDHYQPGRQPTSVRNSEQFLEDVEQHLAGQRPVEVAEAARAVFGVLSRHISPGEVDKVRHSLPEDIRRRLWPQPGVEAQRPAPGEAPEARP
jgi:uncharacterized protein (DUF2267 family)